MSTLVARDTMYVSKMLAFALLLVLIVESLGHNSSHDLVSSFLITTSCRKVIFLALLTSSLHYAFIFFEYLFTHVGNSSYLLTDM